MGVIIKQIALLCQLSWAIIIKVIIINMVIIKLSSLLKNQHHLRIFLPSSLSPLYSSSFPPSMP